MSLTPPQQLVDPARYQLADPSVFDLTHFHFDIWALNHRDLTAQKSSFAAVLQPEEVEQGNRFYFEKDRNQYVLTRGSLRFLLGAYLNEDPARIEFHFLKGGKPVLKDETLAKKLYFNVSHSGGYSLLGFSSRSLLGVDIESVNPEREMEAIAERYFSPGEVAQARKMEGEKREFRYFQLWSLKEALLKGVGEGLGIPLNEVEISGFELPGMDKQITDRSGKLAGWSVQSLVAPAPGFTAALAWQGASHPLRYFRLSTEAPPLDSIGGSL